MAEHRINTGSIVTRAIVNRVDDQSIFNPLSCLGRGKAAKMVGIVLLVGGLAALFALLYFTRPEIKSTGLLHATAGTLSIGIPALITIGFLMAGKVFLGIGCTALTLLTVNMFFPLWRHIRGFLPDKIQKPYEGKGWQNRARRQAKLSRNDRPARKGGRQNHR